jgi:GT2 family glycosyltransferase
VTAEPALTTVVVSWRSRADVVALAAEFPVASRHELVVVDNSGELAPTDLGVGGDARRLLRPGRNLGFAGGCNLGARAARGEQLLFLNPDARPIGDAFDAVLAGFARFADADGIVPRLVGADGAEQHRWQLRPLPSAPALVAHAFFWNPARGPAEPPAAGSAIAQPAAAALALRRAAFEAVGGFDERFAPAWFEDVDLARRLAARGARLVYHPEASFRHRSGSALESTGYGGFLAAYDRNLALYLRLHHGAGWAALFRALVPLGAAARIALLPLRRPRRAASRAAAARALAHAAAAALRGWPAVATPAVSR